MKVLIANSTVMFYFYFLCNGFWIRNVLHTFHMIIVILLFLIRSFNEGLRPISFQINFISISFDSVYSLMVFVFSWNCITAFRFLTFASFFIDHFSINTVLFSGNWCHFLWLFLNNRLQTFIWFFQRFMNFFWFYGTKTEKVVRVFRCLLSFDIFFWIFMHNVDKFYYPTALVNLIGLIF